MRFLLVLVLLVLALPLGACSASRTDASGHAPFPQEIYQGGILLTAPKVVTVTFPGDSMASQLQSFGRSVASSSWWDGVRANYCESPGGACVGDGPPGTFVELTTAAASSYTDSDQGAPSSLRDWLSNAITTSVLPKPDANSNTLYVLYFPKTTAVTLDGLSSCTDNGFDGYHDAMTFESQEVAYAVVVECDPLTPLYPNIDVPSVLSSTTVTASHEIFEASTDPESETGYTLDETDPNNWGWADIVGDEAADLCVDPFVMNQDETSDGTYTVQRIWSNQQAGANLDPCHPIPSGETYFNAAPSQAFFVLGVGASATFEVDAFSDGPRSDWTLTAQDWTESTTDSYLDFSIAGAQSKDGAPLIQVNTGSKVQVTVTLLRDPGALETDEADGAIISFSGDPNAPTAAHWWPFAVMSTADAIDAGVGTSTTARRKPAPARRRPHVHRPTVQRKRARSR
jgi:hypothetical protein